MTKLAVYGSLREGLGNHRTIRGCQKLSTETIYLPFKMVSHVAYPSLQLDTKYNPVVIEVYEVDGASLRRADSLEGFTNNPDTDFYSRTEVETSVGTAYLYYLNRQAPPEAKHITDWAAYRELSTPNNYEED